MEVTLKVRELLATRQFSQEALAQRLGTSDTQLSNIVNEKWRTEKYPTDKTWLKIAANISGTGSGEAVTNEAAASGGSPWRNIGTKTWTAVHDVCASAQKYSELKCVSAPTGAGKTTALKAAVNPTKYQSRYYLFCTQLHTPMAFLRALAKALGLETHKKYKVELYESIINRVNSSQQPLIILDDVSKLPIGTFPLLQTLYDATEGNCGWVWAGLDSLREFMAKKAKDDKPSFRELKRRSDDWTELNHWRDAAQKRREITAFLDLFELGEGENKTAVLNLLCNNCGNIGELKKLLTNAWRSVAQGVILHKVLLELLPKTP